MSRPDELVPVVVVTRHRGGVSGDMPAQAAQAVVADRKSNQGRITTSVKIWVGPHEVTFPACVVKNLLVF